WLSRTREMRESMIAMGFGIDDMPSWFHEGIVFGEIPQSANHFVIQPGGDEAGQVFYCDHDDFRIEPITTSFEELLDRITNDPPGFLYQCGCFARIQTERLTFSGSRRSTSLNVAADSETELRCD